MTTSAPLRRRTLLTAALALGLITPATVAGCSAETLDLARADVARRPADATVGPETLAGLSRFSGVALHRLAATQPDANLICSPLSMWLALAMTRNGARGATAEEMDHALAYPELARLNAGLSTLTQQLTARSGQVEVGDTTGDIALDLVNQVFGEQSISWREEFLIALGEFYGTGVARSDFVRDPAGQRRAINAFVADATQDAITELVPADLITPDTRMVLVNAIHLKAPWATRFADPVDGEFATRDGARTTPMMTASYAGRGARGDGWRAVEIPYLGGTLAMTVILPDQGEETRVRGRLPDGLLAEVLAALEPGATITVTLPTFSFRTAARLKPMLQGLGMRSAFDDADLSGMTGQVGLVITDVVHQGWIAVDQNGTEAAAATAVVVAETAGAALPERRLELVLDRPFWFVIHDVTTAAPLLVGQTVDPTSRS